MIENSQSIKRSLAIRLLRIVFSIYLVITITITLVQMWNQYKDEKSEINDELISYQRIFSSSITTALWNFDSTQLAALTEGITEFNSVIGVQIVNFDDEIINSTNVIGVNDKDLLQRADLNLFHHSFTLTFDKNNLGTVYIFSSEKVVFDNVKYDFAITIILAIIKTSILWILFLWVFRKNLTVALESFISKMEKIDFTAIPEKGVHFDTFNTIELIRVRNVFNDMLSRLYDSQSELKALNENLEKKVTERTHQIYWQKELLESISRQSRIGAWEYNPNSNTLHWSKMVGEILELWDDFDVSLQNVASFYPENYFENLLNRLKDEKTKAEQPIVEEFEMTTGGGNKLWVIANTQADYDEDGKCIHVYGSLQDFSARKRIEQDLLQAKDLAESAAKAKSQLIATTSHELKSPIHSLLTLLNNLKNSLITPEQVHQVELAVTSTQILLDIVNKVVDFTKLEAGSMKLVSEPLHLRDLVEQVVEVKKQDAHEKQLELVLDTHALTYEYVLGDPRRVRQIFMELISNAIKFSEKGSICISCETSLDSTSEQISLAISVRDQGSGIDQDAKAHVFKAYVITDDGSVRFPKGTGLGLAITKQLCELMNGQLNFESGLENGSKFSADVVLALDKTKPTDSDTADDGENFSIDGKRILFIGPDNEANKVVHRQLNYLGAQVRRDYHFPEELFTQENGNSFELQEPDLDALIVDQKTLHAEDKDLLVYVRYMQSLKSLKLILLESPSDGNEVSAIAGIFDLTLQNPVMKKDYENLAHLLEI